jgi:DNA-directed RNA polymerase subunit N (RpoN/RPB10)
MTRSDLTEVVSHALDLPRNESDIIVATILSAIVRSLRGGAEVVERWVDFQNALADKRRYPVQRFKALLDALGCRSANCRWFDRAWNTY